MIHIVLKIISGEEIIGCLSVKDMAEASTLDYLLLIDPMWIIADSEGSMRLRAATILAEENKLIIFPDSIAITYKPSTTLIEYYKTMLEYVQKHTQGEIDKQIQRATKELEHAINETEEFESNLTQFIAKASKVSIH